MIARYANYSSKITEMGEAGRNRKEEREKKGGERERGRERQKEVETERARERELWCTNIPLNLMNSQFPFASKMLLGLRHHLGENGKMVLTSFFGRV